MIRVENLLPVLPSILALGAFAAVMKLVMNSDRLERRAEAELDALELDMPALQARARGLFALATAWTERHDAILAATPSASHRVAR